MNALTYLFRGIVLACALGLSACASITSGKNQPVTVEATCVGKPVIGAQCNLTNDKGKWVTTTPGSVVIQKAYGDLAIECSKEDVGKAVATFSSAHEGAVWGNVIAGGLIGFAVDAGTGAGFSYPPQMVVDFKPECAPPPAAAPVAETGPPTS